MLSRYHMVFHEEHKKECLVDICNAAKTISGKQHCYSIILRTVRTGMCKKYLHPVAVFDIDPRVL